MSGLLLCVEAAAHGRVFGGGTKKKPVILADERTLVRDSLGYG
jgi:hypothetical protein